MKRIKFDTATKFVILIGFISLFLYEHTRLPEALTVLFLKF